MEITDNQSELYQMAKNWYYDKCHGEPDDIIQSLYELLYIVTEAEWGDAVMVNHKQPKQYDVTAQKVRYAIENNYYGYQLYSGNEDINMEEMIKDIMAIFAGEVK